jgi:flavin reductase (DIM6/NTAB) family NADH-FMN oxidoreductase RutF
MPNFDVETLGTQQCYQWMVQAILPRPIAWISTLSEDGTSNLAPYSFFTVASCAPPVLAVTQVNPRNRPAKDTLSNLLATGEAVVNIVSAELAEQMNASCGDYPPDISEFSAVGIASCPSQRVKAPGVAAARVRFECTLRDVLKISDQPSGGSMMLLNVVSIAINDEVLENGAISARKLDAVGKMGGNDYSFTRELFALERPVV